MWLVTKRQLYLIFIILNHLDNGKRSLFILMILYINGKEESTLVSDNDHSCLF